MEFSPAVMMSRDDTPDRSPHIIDLERERIDGVNDDIDFEPSTDDREDVGFLYFPGDAEPGFQINGEDGLSGVGFELPMGDSVTGFQNDDEEHHGEAEELTAQPAPPVLSTVERIQASPSQMMQLLSQAGLQRLFSNHINSRSGTLNADEDNDFEDGYGGPGVRRKRQPKVKPPPTLNKEDKKLMADGDFGENEYYKEILGKRKPLFVTRLMNRELGISRYNSTKTNKLISQTLIPSSNADTIIHYDKPCYSGQFSDDGNFFFSSAQDFKVRMYDTSNPYKWKYYKTVHYHYGIWTITDASLSPDNRYLAYSSIRSIVSLASTDPSDTSEPLLLDFSDMSHRSSRRTNSGYRQFGIWSIRFSGDGREIVAGTADHCVCVHDIETQKTTLKIPGHDDDVNAVCFGDTASPHILYSGSDDALIKVWDRRSLSDSREAGAFMGHTEGLTYVDSKGDGRYVLSNGKDQTMKLWDLRRMIPVEKSPDIDPKSFSTKFDYRSMPYSDTDYRPHPHDCSVVTYRGHRVLKTLIRCHFSPPGSTNSRYVYSGSEDGSVYIYHMDSTLASKIDVEQATRHSRPRDPDLDFSTYYFSSRRGKASWKTCVRDASWHPNAPVVAATSWNGWGMSTGTCTTHSWNDGAKDDEAEPKLGLHVNEHLQYDEDLFDNSRASHRRTGLFRVQPRSRRVTIPDGVEGE